eukprot:TRINITY_DN250_c0_g1_i7.p4 TRINITY_DN250_c0_g1~~TRINITY_DN250_c0_g1_i7.p4  ORF type:complete len:78 (-),score=15.98 TRINITY_DN250_c0_g1_i7:258-491(-)
MISTVSQPKIAGVLIRRVKTAEEPMLLTAPTKIALAEENAKPEFGRTLASERETTFFPCANIYFSTVSILLSLLQEY